MKPSWKPSKKTIAVIGAFFVLSGFFVWFNRDKELVPRLSKDDIISASAEDISSRDSDGDSIRDWEEFLWNLDPNKKDTDGNGLSDDKELEVRKVALRSSATPSGVATTTFTDTFSKEFFVAFSSLKQSGNLTKTNIDQISKQSLAALTQTTIKEKYTKEDLVLASSTPEAKKQYEKAVQNSRKNLSVKSLGRELELLSRAINKPRSEKLIQELTKIQQIYFTLAERTIKIPAPNAIQNTHLELANTYYKLGAAVGGLTLIYDDPALSIVYFSEYQKALDRLPNTMKAIETFIK